MTDLITRALNYVATLPPAVSGERGHDAAFRVAATLVHGFALSEAEAMPIMEHYNASCVPPWSEKSWSTSCGQQPSGRSTRQASRPSGRSLKEGRRGSAIRSKTKEEHILFVVQP